MSKSSGSFKDQLRSSIEAAEAEAQARQSRPDPAVQQIRQSRKAYRAEVDAERRAVASLKVVQARMAEEMRGDARDFVDVMKEMGKRPQQHDMVKPMESRGWLGRIMRTESTQPVWIVREDYRHLTGIVKDKDAGYGGWRGNYYGQEFSVRGIALDTDGELWHFSESRWVNGDWYEVAPSQPKVTPYNSDTLQLGKTLHIDRWATDDDLVRMKVGPSIEQDIPDQFRRNLGRLATSSE